MVDISQTEILFWKIFKNKILLSKIFCKSLNYERLVKADEILIRFNDGISVIKERVRNSSYITYNSIEPIYNKITKDTFENIDFYKQLFTNYPKYFMFSEIALPLIFKCSNLVALRVYIDQFKITNDQINYLANSYYKVLIINHSNSQILNYKSFKMLSHLILYHGVQLRSSVEMVETVKGGNLYYMIIYFKGGLLTFGQLLDITKSFISFFSNGIKINFKNKKLDKDKFIDKFISALLDSSCPGIGSSKSFSLSTTDIVKKKLFSKTINFEPQIKFVSALNNNNSNNNNNNDFVKNKSDIKKNKSGSISKFIKELESNELVKQHLDIDILKLLRVCTFIDCNCSELINNSNINNSNSNNSNSNNSSNNNILNFIKRCKELRAYILKLIKSYFLITNESIEIWYKKQICEDISSLNILEYCSYFFNYMYSYFNSISNNNNNIIENNFILNCLEIILNNNKSITPFLVILEIGDLKLIELFHQKYKESIESLFNSSYNDYNIGYLMRSIKSTAVLDFFYKNYQDSPIFTNHSVNWKYISSIPILEHYEMLIKNMDFKLLIDDYKYFNPTLYQYFIIDKELKPLFRDLEQISLELLSRALESQSSLLSVYQLSNNFLLSSCQKIVSEYIQYERHDILVSIFKHLKLPEINLVSIIEQERPFKLLRWIANNYSQKDQIPYPTDPNPFYTVRMNLNYPYGIDYQETVTVEMSVYQLFYSFIFSEGFNNAIELIKINPLVFKYHKFIENNKKTTPLIVKFLDYTTNYYFTTLENIDDQDKSISTLITILKSILIFYLKDSAVSGNIDFFKILFIKYSYFIKKQFKNGETLLEPLQLVEILNNASKSNNIDILEVILSNYYTNFSKNEYYKLINQSYPAHQYFLKFK
ncbi:hypothetical protein DICPUDRAFT_78214 [Dictyostelium purpureum]|uniref:Uncharacterized protein n=1 Tax=Dictyostelium purpureum TaxID=5786 RepID=F0ZIW6_DICPU|nr:uncharacterized protein DICPUDRAFT_78214 [Dictyostelium purpureum]EGC36113.1 hypothetical protein DICPUDRAFT_78214 [Dictyostelium purpureum]|eukprot:XP_003287370.1 hypothetical protein DICPUDRAFT_78214 [Dictyostelium purpureum]